MSPWLLIIVVLLVAFTLAAAVLAVPVLRDLYRHQKGRIEGSKEPENGG
ncbi:MAG: hypothetical protein AB1772_00445 [Candidatus Zixiibacteriota bacterium]